MDIFIYLIYLAFGGFILFLIIAAAVKIAVREVLFEFKEEIINELNQKKTVEESDS